MEYKIIHNEAESRFETLVEGKLALVDYEKRNNILDITHTEVPKELEGRGIAGAITQFVLEYIKSNGLKIHPICPYTVAYLKRHSEYQDLIE